jgi:hypothetical protein
MGDTNYSADGSDYQELMNFEPSQAHDIFGPFLTEQALSDVPLFGPKKANIKSLVEKSLTGAASEERLVAELFAGSHSSLLFEDASSVADKLKALRLASKQGNDQLDEALLSQLERHEKLLTDTKDMAGLSSKERFAVDNTMLLRAQEGYRFDFAKNREIVADDPWLTDVWVWVAGRLTDPYRGCPDAHFSNRRRGSRRRRWDDVAPSGCWLYGSP